jgi:GMP synthase-like glutamine amidotransferase
VDKERPLVGLQFHPEYTRRMVTYYAREHSRDWISSDYVNTKDEVLAQTEEIPDTYWLMELLLNNIAQEFAVNI